MGNFTLKPGASAVFLPGAGRVLPGVVLSGEQFRRFVPQFLVEMPEAQVETKAAAAHPPAVIHLAAAPKEVPPPAPPSQEAAAPVPSEPVKKPAPSAPAAKPAPESPPAEAPAIMPSAGSESARREKSQKKKG